MSAFIFDRYEYDSSTKVASFFYEFENGQKFCERIEFAQTLDGYNQDVFERAMFLAFTLIGTSYFKTAPTNEVRFNQGAVDEWQADFLNQVYQEGMSQFAFENQLTREDLAHFQATGSSVQATSYHGEGILALQSGGKDSILLAQKLHAASKPFTSFYISSADVYPEVIDRLGMPVYTAKRILDHGALNAAKIAGGLNGHIPLTYVSLALGLLQAVLAGKNAVLSAIGHEGEEAHDWIGDLPVNHQWAKTWQAEQLFVEYVNRYISADIRVGSPIRQFSELSVAKQFVESSWTDFSRQFSSCNLGNYKQGAPDQQLRWCGKCPKCANSYLLFAPFVPADDLQAVFQGDLFERDDLVETFKGLLDVDGVMKPFECVGEVDELRAAYHMAQAKGGYAALPFTVPASQFDIDAQHPAHDFSDILT